MNRTSRLYWLVLALLVSVATPSVADEYLIFTDAGIPGGGSDVWVWCDGQSPTNPCDLAQIQECANPEGVGNFRQRTVGAWMGFGVFHNVDPGPDGTPGTGDEFPTPVDLSAFLGGEMRFFAKSPFDLAIEMQCEVGGATTGASRLLSQTNWDGSDTWQEIVIPLADFAFPSGPPVDRAECLGAVLAPFLSTAANLPVALNTFQIDNVRWRQPNAHAGASSVQVSGRQLMVNGEPFVVRGMAYSPISIGEDFRGALIDRPDRYLVDFPLIAASGANTVRIYSSFLTTAMLDAAWSNGLFVIPTFPVNLAQNGCAEGQQFMQDRMQDMVQQWKDHPAILFWMVGNEINRGLTGTQLCDPTTGWYPQLNSLAQAAKLVDPSHPVATGNSDTTGLADICDPGCSDDLALPDLDIWGLQIYRGCTFGLPSAFDEYQAKASCSRPMIITEFGADSWDSMSGPSGAENQAMQSDCLQTLLAEADQALAVRTPGGVSAGQIVFSWADEWWKAFALDPPQAGFCSAADNTLWSAQDTCKSWEALGYPDPAMNEEWWGVTSLDPADPDARVNRAAYTRVGESWNVGDVCNLGVVSHDEGSGDTTIFFDPAPGSTDHTLYYGPLNAVSTYGYTGSVSGLGATGASSVTLPPGELFWLVVGRNTVAEGGYGTGLAERPPSPGAAVPQSPNRTALCSSP